MRLRGWILAALALVPFAAGSAQSAGVIRASSALRASHIGALTPLMAQAMISRRLNGAQLGIRYGLLDEGGVRTHAVAGSGIFATGVESSVTLTAGVTDRDCTSCNPAMLLGVGGDVRLYEMGSGSTLSIAVSGDLAYGQLKPRS